MSTTTESTPHSGYWATADADGRINAYYHTDVNGDAIPDGAVPITDSQWRDSGDVPGAWMIRDGAIVNESPPPFPPGPPPTYAEQRQAHYPSIPDQLDMLYHDPTGATFRAAIKAVKDAYPKPQD